MEDTIRRSIGHSNGSMDELVAAVDSLREITMLNLDIIKSKFEDVTSSLNIDQETCTTAWTFIENLHITSDTNEHDQKHYIACALFIAGNVKFNSLVGRNNGIKQPRHNSVYLSQLLKATNIKLKDFFEGPLQSFVLCLGLGKPVEDQLKRLEQTFVILNILYRKYEELFTSLFNYSGVVTMGGKDRSSEEYLFGIGWFIYLYCKSRLFQEVPDLMQSIHLILCSLNYVYVHSPTTFRKRPIQELQQLYQQSPPSSTSNNNTNNNNNNNILGYLCKTIGSNYEELLNINQKTFSIFIDILLNGNVIKSSNNGINDYFTVGMLPINFGGLNKIYEQSYYSNGDIDERIFLFDKEIVGTPFKSTAVTPSSKKFKPEMATTPILNKLKQQDGAGSYPTTPVKGSRPLPQTPISSSLSMIEWLKKSIQKSDTKPSADLAKILKELSTSTVDLTEQIVTRVNNLSEPVGELFSFKDNNKENNDQEMNNQTDHNNSNDISTTTPKNKRKVYGVKLYYTLLEKILNYEKVRAGHTPGFMTLLMHGEFHRSLLATSFEIIAHSHKLAGLEFPYFVDMFNVHPFSYIRIIENIIKVEGALPQLLINHFTSIEEQIVERHAWNSTSPVFALFAQHRDQLAPLVYALSNNNVNSTINNSTTATITNAAPSTPTKSNSILGGNFTQTFSTPTKSWKHPPFLSTTTSPIPSPMKESINNHQNNHQNHQNNNTTTPNKPKPTVLLNFYKKVYHHTIMRCKLLCQSLSIPSDIHQQIVLVILAAVMEQTTLLKNRTLEIIIICTVYAICKVNDHPLSFKTIIESSNIPQIHYKEVILSDEGTKGDIIAFYNKIYLHQMDPTIYKYKDQHRQLHPQSNNNGSINFNSNNSIRMVPSTPTKIITPMSPNKLTTSAMPVNITISPMAPHRQHPVNNNSNNNNNSIISTQPLFNNNHEISSSNNQNQPGTPSKLAGSYSIGRTPSKELKSINMNINNQQHNNNNNNASNGKINNNNNYESLASSTSSTSSSSSSTVSPVLSAEDDHSQNNNISNNNINTNNNSNGKSKGKRLFFGDDSNSLSLSSSSSSQQTLSQEFQSTPHQHPSDDNSRTIMDDNDHDLQPPLKK